MNYTAKEFVYKFLCGHRFSCLLDIIRKRISGSHGNSLFNVLELHDGFQSGGTVFYFDWQCIRDPVSARSHQYLLSFFFLLNSF